MRILAVIPARMGSNRFPGKPLAPILNKPMIHHVYERSAASASVEDVFIATCDEEIRSYCESQNIPVVMTKDTHERASDRAAEALEIIEADKNNRYDIVLMIQGDEPMLNPRMIDEVLRPLIEDPSIPVANLMAPLKDFDEANDPNEVKVVVNRDNFALYFSREPIPSAKKSKDPVTCQKQVCLIPFQRDFLIEFNRLEPTPLEIIESVDMLRVLEHGRRVKMVPTKYETYSVDTPEDLKRVETRMRQNPFSETQIF